MELEQSIIGHGKPIATTKLNQIIQKGENSTCLIKYLNYTGSGFFCKINFENEKSYIFLFTNNHILNENFINNNSNLVISYKGQEKEIILKNRIKYTNVNLDFTIIEMKKEDKINDYF